MSPPTSPHDLERNLLFALLAYQVDFITREQLLDATKDWRGQRSRPLDLVLVERGAISEAERQLLFPLVQQHLANHGQDAQQSLAGLSGLGSVLDDLRNLDDDLINAATLSLDPGQPVTDALDQTAPHSTARTSPGQSPGQHVSETQRFRVLRPHARGGLGEVSVAKDLELNRDVALKEIRPQFADDQASRTRFLLEAEITGGLEHPGIVPVYGLGQYEDGRPFYAMRFIQGDSLKEAIDRFHRNATQGTGTVDFGSVEFRKLLGRFIDVCQAIEYAHSRGVLHRDLKPGNIMLGKYGETLVVDWGLAKPKEGPQLEDLKGEVPLQPASASGSTPTLMGSAIGTPAFMPPEQARGELDSLGPASDVYSLGATLYYLLTGGPPFRGKSAATVLSQVKEGTFPKPVQLQAQLPKALDAVCCKAMAFKIADRYPSPMQLADEIERFLADEPVRAMRDPLAVRARRWLRRHQTLAAATAATVLIGLFSLAAFSTMLSGKNRELNRLVVALNQKTTALEESTDRERSQRLRAEAGELAAREQSELAVETLNDVIYDLQRGLEDLPGGSSIRQRLLSTSLSRLDAIATQYVDQGQVNSSAVAGLLDLGSTVLELGRLEAPLVERLVEGFAETPQATLTNDSGPAIAKDAVGIAIRCFTRAVEMARQLRAAEPTQEQTLRLLTTALQNLSLVQRIAGGTESAIATNQEGLQLARELVRQQASIENRSLHAALLEQHASSLALQLGRPTDAIPPFREAEQIRQQLLDENPESDALRAKRITLDGKLTDVLLRSENIQEAEQYALRAVNGCEESGWQLAAADSIQHASLAAAAYADLAHVQFRLGKHEPAVKTAAKALSIREAMSAQVPGNQTREQDVAETRMLLAYLQMAAGQLTQSVDSYRQARQTIDGLIEQNPGDGMLHDAGVRCSAYLGLAYRIMGAFDEAIDSYTLALERATSRFSADPTNTRWLLVVTKTQKSMGAIYLDQGDLAKAAIHLEAGKANLEKLTQLETQGLDVIEVDLLLMAELGELYYRQGNATRALAQFEAYAGRALEFAEANPTDWFVQSSYVEALRTLGEFQLALHHTTDAEVTLQRAQAVAQQCVEHDPSDFRSRLRWVQVLTLLGELRRGNQQDRDAKAAYERAEAELTRLLAGNDGNSEAEEIAVRIYRGLSLLHQRTKDWEAAELELEKSLQLMQSSTSRYPENRQLQGLALNVLKDLGELALEQGNTDRARARFSEAIAVETQYQGARDYEDWRMLGELELKLGEAHRRDEHLEEASRAFERAEDHFAKLTRDRSTINLNAWINLGMLNDRQAILAHDQKDFSKAAEYFEKGLEIAEVLKKNGYPRADDVIENINVRLRDARLREQVHGDWEDLLRRPPRVRAYLLHIRGQDRVTWGELPEAERVANELRGMTEGDRYVNLAHAACIYSRLAAAVKQGVSALTAAQQEARYRELRDQSLDALRQSVDAGWFRMDYLARHGCLAELRSEPRFVELCQTEFTDDELMIRLERDLPRLEAEIAHFPNVASNYLDRAEVLARLRRWHESGDDLVRYAKIAGPERARVDWLRAAASYVIAGNLDKHRDVCQQIEATYGQSLDPARADIVCKAMNLVPGFAEQSERFSGIIADAVRQGNPAWFTSWGASTLALHAYRQGEWDKAQRWTGLIHPQAAARKPHCLGLAVQAMCEVQQDKLEDARRTLQRLDALLPSEASDLLEPTVHAKPLRNVSVDWLIVGHLRNEALELLKTRKGQVDLPPVPTSN